jgi:MerR family mercuric resistance operon transcriptional regulator/MerR family Zn(II)-responsive transcriptional regulator of zntA
LGGKVGNHPMEYYLRSEIAKLANINIETLRYYEMNKIIPLPPRAQNGYRQYSEDILKRLLLIIQVKECGFTLEEIRNLFPIDNAKEVSEKEAISILDKKVSDIDDMSLRLERIKELLLKIKSEIIEPECPEVQKVIRDYMKLKR